MGILGWQWTRTKCLVFWCFCSKCALTFTRDYIYGQSQSPTVKVTSAQGLVASTNKSKSFHICGLQWPAEGDRQKLWVDFFFFWGGITSLLLSKSKFSMLLQWTSLKLICKCPAYNTPHLLSSCGHFKMVKYKLCLHHRILLRSFSGPLVLVSNLSWAQSLLCGLTFPQGLKSCWERSLWVVH